jgi:hypothetical protein
MLPFYSNRASLPLTLHYDSISNPTFDILFGMPKELALGAGYRYGNSNLVTNYYFRFLNEITNKNSKIVRAYFRITPSDWYNLQFKNLYFFEGQYWRLNKVENYNPTKMKAFICVSFCWLNSYNQQPSQTKPLEVEREEDKVRKPTVIFTQAEATQSNPAFVR